MVCACSTASFRLDSNRIRRVVLSCSSLFSVSTSIFNVLTAAVAWSLLAPELFEFRNQLFVHRLLFPVQRLILPHLAGNPVQRRQELPVRHSRAVYMGAHCIDTRVHFIDQRIQRIDLARIELDIALQLRDPAGRLQGRYRASRPSTTE